MPLFREIQRVLLSSTGPVNWELARQVGIAGTAVGRRRPQATEDDRTVFEEAVRVAEMHVAGFTSLVAPTGVASVRAVRRAEWIGANTTGLAGLLSPRPAGSARRWAAGGLAAPESMRDGRDARAGSRHC